VWCSFHLSWFHFGAKKYFCASFGFSAGRVDLFLFSLPLVFSLLPPLDWVLARFFSAFGLWFCGAPADRPQLMFVFPFGFLKPASNLPRTLARFRAQEFHPPVEPLLPSLTRPGDQLLCAQIWFPACLIFLWFPRWAHAKVWSWFFDAHDTARFRLLLDFSCTVIFRLLCSARWLLVISFLFSFL
jgi:hypothetical protein